LKVLNQKATASISQMAKLLPELLGVPDKSALLKGAVLLVEKTTGVSAIVIKAANGERKIVEASQGLQAYKEEVLNALSNLLTISLTGRSCRQGIINLKKGNILGVATAPVFNQEEPLFLAALSDPPRWFKQDEILMLQLIAAQLKLALYFSGLIETAGTYGIRDPLTGCYNSLFLWERLREECLRAERASSCLSVLFIDIDNFKQINDNFGHRQGDAVLRQVAAELAAVTRPYDLLGRYGGDEFVIICPNTGPETGTRIGERLCRWVKESFDFSLPITISCGLASSPPLPLEPELLLMKADTAMYRAKQEGRNRVALAQ